MISYTIVSIVSLLIGYFIGHNVEICIGENDWDDEDGMPYESYHRYFEDDGKN